jgi:hypothetical protein
MRCADGPGDRPVLQAGFVMKTEYFLDFAHG